MKTPSQQVAAPSNRQRLLQIGSGTFRQAAAPSSRPWHLQIGSGTFPQMAEPLQGIAAPFSSRKQQGEGTVTHSQQSWTEAATQIAPRCTRRQVAAPLYRQRHSSNQVTAPSTEVTAPPCKLQYPLQVTVHSAVEGSIQNSNRKRTAAINPLPRQGRNKKLTKTGLQQKILHPKQDCTISGLRPQISEDSTHRIET